MNTIVKIIFGSHLYGTNTSESDRDFKGVFLPSLDDCILNRVKKSISNNSNNTHDKNSSLDIDSEYYSLQYFLGFLGIKGETAFLDMLHAPDSCIVETSPTWERIRSKKEMFYTKNLKSYLGYCRKQAAKYGIKGSRLSDTKKVLEFLYKLDPGEVMSDVWDKLPTGEHLKHTSIPDALGQDPRAYEVCGRKIMFNTKVEYAISVIKKIHDNYGERAKMACNNLGIDWKAVSHAFRAGYQLKRMYQTGEIVFPLPEATFIKKVKKGVLHYKDDFISEKLEDLIDVVDDLSTKSKYPEHVDRLLVDQMILDAYKT